MFLTIILLLAGLALVVFGADLLVDGASSVAKRAGVSEFVIGLTVVGFGTSCPELVVSLTGALQGNADIAVGNVLGSNVFNVLFILGVTAVLSPFTVSDACRNKDLRALILVTVSLAAFIAAGTVSRIAGAVFLLAFAAYMFLCFRGGGTEKEDDGTKVRSLPLSIVLVLAGLAGLIFGGDLFVDNAVAVARAAGVSDKFIAVTLLAGGTSLPELVTCIVAAAKHRDSMALGNIVGSCIFNILLILGCSALITPLHTRDIGGADIAALLLSGTAVSLLTAGKGNRTLTRGKGALMVAVFLAYFAFLFFSI